MNVWCVIGNEVAYAYRSVSHLPLPPRMMDADTVSQAITALIATRITDL